MTLIARIGFIGVALVAGLIGYKILRTSRSTEPAPADPLLTYVAENAEKLREQIKESKDYEQRMADQQRLEMQELDDGIEREPENAELRVQRALKYSTRGDYAAALRDIEVALPLENSRRYYLLYLRHLQLDKLGRHEEALADVLAAIQIAPPNFNYHKAAAELHRRLGNAEAGVAVLDGGIQRDPGNLFLRADRAEFVATLGRYEEALRDITLAIDKEPDEFQRQSRTYHRIRYLAATRRFDEALEDASQLLKRNPRDTIALHARGDVFKAMGDDRRAEADYDSAMNITMDR